MMMRVLRSQAPRFCPIAWAPLCSAALVAVLALLLAVADASASKCGEACEEHGVCREGRCWCEKGWVGEDCSREGDNPCDMSCFDRGACDAATMVCDCEQGWSGPYCGRKSKQARKAARAANGEKAEAERAELRARRERRAARCPSELKSLPWWQRYDVPAGLDKEAVLARLRACEGKADPTSCVRALVGLGEVRRPPFAGCEYSIVQSRR